MATSTETISFFGASAGVGLAALKHTLATGRKCIALCRTPDKLSDILSPETHPNLKIIQGNAHDVSAVSSCILALSTIGVKPIASDLTIDDPNVCRKEMTVLLKALRNLRSVKGKPHVIVYSTITTGISRFGRDIPLLMIPLYYIYIMPKVPHEDKVVMEDPYEVRVGIDGKDKGKDKGRDEAIGYVISKGDAGRWG
ncbi:hypothetical protein GGS20DRAFT_578528 [Poronia punctata]|nr:hypothetical protein GGS20DRAFT_578528 [Poronia punctata]